MKTNLILAIGVFSLAGCSLAPSEQRPASPVPENWPSNKGSGGRSVDDVGWKDFIRDPQLEKLVARALANNRDFRIATLRVEESQAKYRIRRTSAYPQVDVQAGSNRSRGQFMGLTSQYSASVDLAAYELDLFGRVRNLNQSALQDYFATTAAQRGAQIALVAEVSTQYLTACALRDQIQLSERTLASVKNNLELIKKRFDAGDVSELDYQSVVTQVKAAEANLANYRQQLAQSENAIAFLIGSAGRTNLTGNRSLADGIVMENIAAGASSDLLRRRPDILAAEHGLLGANADIAAARAAFFPRISLTASAGTSSSELSKLFSGGTDIWSFAPKIEFPIFRYGFNRANLDVAKVRQRIEVATYEKSIQAAFREVADALAGRRGISQQINAYEGLTAAQQKRFELASARYEKGVDSYFEVLNAQQDLYGAQQALIQLRLARQANAVQLYKALGGGW